MINTKENKENNTKENKLNENLNEEFFFSLKNKSVLKFKTKAERFLMLLVEFDPLVDAYKQFEFKLVSVQAFKELESNPALIVDGDGKRQYIIISDRLAGNDKLAKSVCDQLQKSEPIQIALTVMRPNDVETSILAKNVDFLYQFASLPACPEDFSILKNRVNLIEETSIKQLKLLVKNEASIYQLIFHRALRGDLHSALISDDTFVTASPIINSIVNNL